MNHSTPPSTKHEEPEPTQEEAVPSDGKDIEGEEMMKKVQNKKLHEPGDRESKTPDKGA